MDQLGTVQVFDGLLLGILVDGGQGEEKDGKDGQGDEDEIFTEPQGTTSSTKPDRISVTHLLL
jgi:hypothetical protein